LKTIKIITKISIIETTIVKRKIKRSLNLKKKFEFKFKFKKNKTSNNKK